MRKKNSFSWILNLLILIVSIKLINNLKEDNELILVKKLLFEYMKYIYTNKIFSIRTIEGENDCINATFNILLSDANTVFQLFQYNGKEIGDLGNEIECKNSHNKPEFFYLMFLFKYQNYDKILDENNKIVIDFLNQTYHPIGICFFKECKKMVEKLIHDEHFLLFIKNQFNVYEPEIIVSENEKENIVGKYLFNGSLIFLFLKIFIGVIKFYVYPKGYAYSYNKIKGKKIKFNHIINESINEVSDDENKNKEENKSIEQIKSNNVINENENQKQFLKNIKNSKYIPEFDNSSDYPFTMKLFKFLDIFDNIKNLSVQYNRFFNSNNINSLITIKAIILFFIVYHTILNVKIKLPGRYFNMDNFYDSFFFILVKLSTFATISLIMIDAAILGFKIMSFMKNEINKRNRFNPLLLLTFLILNIPKISIFFFIYFTVYIYGIFSKHVFKNYNALYEYYNKNLQDKNHCYQNYISIFSPLFLYEDYSEMTFNKCYEFVYLYENEFYILIFIIFFILFCFFLKNQAFEKMFFILGIIYFFFIQIFNYIQISKINPQSFQKEDSKTSMNFKLIHILGENYSIKLPHLAFTYYFFGFIIGICYFFYYDSKDKLPLIENKEIKNNCIYIPFKFCEKFVNYLNRLSNIKKNVCFILNLLFIILLSLNHKFLKIELKSNENKESHTNLKIFFFYFEKFTFAFCFFFLNLFILVFPNDSLIKEILSNEIFIIFERVSFSFFCLCDSIIFLAFSIFFLKINISHFNILIYSIGLYLILLILSLIITILIEYPIRIFIKLLIRRKPNKSELEIISSINSVFSLSSNEKEVRLLDSYDN